MVCNFIRIKIQLSQSSSLMSLSHTGIDDLLARHLAHLFIRDPLVIYDELLHQDNETSTDHFEVTCFCMKYDGG